MAHCNWIGEHRIVMSRLGHILWVHIVHLHYLNLNYQISKGPLFSPSLYFFFFNFQDHQNALWLYLCSVFTKA